MWHLATESLILVNERKLTWLLHVAHTIEETLRLRVVNVRTYVVTLCEIFISVRNPGPVLKGRRNVLIVVVGCATTSVRGVPEHSMRVSRTAVHAVLLGQCLHGISHVEISISKRSGVVLTE